MNAGCQFAAGEFHILVSRIRLTNWENSGFLCLYCRQEVDRYRTIVKVHANRLYKSFLAPDGGQLVTANTTNKQEINHSLNFFLLYRLLAFHCSECNQCQIIRAWKLSWCTWGERTSFCLFATYSLILFRFFCRIRMLTCSMRCSLACLLAPFVCALNSHTLFACKCNAGTIGSSESDANKRFPKIPSKWDWLLSLHSSNLLARLLDCMLFPCRQIRSSLSAQESQRFD